MTIALAVYLYASPMLPPDEMHKAKAAGLAKKQLDRNEWRAVLALITLFLPTTMFWATYEQQGNTIALWADEHTDRTIDLIVWHGEIPVTWFQAFNPFMIFTFTPFIIKFWAWQEKRGIELLLRGPLLSDHGGRGMVGGRQFGELVVAVRPLRRHHHRRALSLPHRVIARFEDRAGAHDLDDDGPVARHQLHRQFRRRLARQLLELHGQDKLLHYDRRCRGKRRRGDLVLQSPAQRHPAGLGPALLLVKNRRFGSRFGHAVSDPNSPFSRRNASTAAP